MIFFRSFHVPKWGVLSTADGKLGLSGPSAPLLGEGEREEEGKDKKGKAG